MSTDNMTPRERILQQAADLTTGDRLEQYGDFRQQSLRLAMIWQAVTELPIQPYHVGLMLAGLKMVRATTSKDLDSEVDLAAYAALHAEAWKCRREPASERDPEEPVPDAYTER